MLIVGQLFTPTPNTTYGGGTVTPTHFLSLDLQKASHVHLNHLIYVKKEDFISYIDYFMFYSVCIIIYPTYLKPLPWDGNRNQKHSLICSISPWHKKASTARTSHSTSTTNNPNPNTVLSGHHVEFLWWYWYWCSCCHGVGVGDKVGKSTILTMTWHLNMIPQCYGTRWISCSSISSMSISLRLNVR